MKWIATALALTALLGSASGDELMGKKKKDPPKAPPKAVPKAAPPPKKKDEPIKKAPPKKSDPPPVRGGGERREEPRRIERRDDDRDRDSIRVGGSNGRQDELLRRDRQRPVSRSGSVRYGSSNNIYRPERVDPIGRAPTIEQLRSGNLGREIRREDNVRVRQEDRSRVRVGYHHWDRDWRDDYFCYPHYSFDPYHTKSMVSPWYYYPYLPGYVSYSRVYTVVSLPPLLFGESYQWRSSRQYRDGYDQYDQYRYDGGRRNDLDYAIEDIQDAFLDRDLRAINRLVPRSGLVTLHVDGVTVYGVRADDFYDMMVDSIESSRTLDYEILEVNVMGDEADVLARHEFRDSWGYRTSVYHKYRLVYDRGTAVIRGFGSSNSSFF